MRTIALIAAALAALAIAQPASAQSAGDILRTIDSTRYDGCRHANGAYKATCQVRRAERVLDIFNPRNGRSNASTELNRQISQIQALQRACAAGDQHSCQRVRGVSSQQITAARALMDACRNGDAFSCDRAEDVLMGTDRSYAGTPTRNAQRVPVQARSQMQAQPARLSPTRLSPTQARIGNCIVDIDPQNGMRTSAPYGCTR